MSYPSVVEGGQLSYGDNNYEFVKDHNNNNWSEARIDELTEKKGATWILQIESKLIQEGTFDVLADPDFFPVEQRAVYDRSVTASIRSRI